MHRDELPIPSPCDADWTAMEPRDRGRFCAACELEVVDVSRHTESEARALVARAGSGRLCVSYVVKPDGSLRTAREPAAPDVPVSALSRKRASTVFLAASLALAACNGPRTAGAPVATMGAVVAAPPTQLDAGTTGASAEPCDPPSDSESVRGEVRVNGGVQPIRPYGPPSE